MSRPDYIVTGEMPSPDSDYTRVVHRQRVVLECWNCGWKRVWKPIPENPVDTRPRP